jgi:hypothetical protein
MVGCKLNCVNDMYRDVTPFIKHSVSDVSLLQAEKASPDVGLRAISHENLAYT